MLHTKNFTFFLETYQIHITFQIDYYLYYKYPSQGFETHHKIKILSCVLWNLLLWIKKDIFRSHYFYAHPFEQRQSQVTMSPYHFNRSPFVIFPINSMYKQQQEQYFFCYISVWYYNDRKFVICRCSKIIFGFIVLLSPGNVCK